MKTGLNPIPAWLSFFFSAQTSIYKEKPQGGNPEKIGGANAPPNSLTKPRKRGFGRVFAARVWPGGHTLLVGLPGISSCLYLGLNLQFRSEILKKWPLIFLLNRLILRGFFSTGFQPLDFALIQWAQINSDLIQNFGGLLGSFLFISLKNGPANKLNN